MLEALVLAGYMTCCQLPKNDVIDEPAMSGELLAQQVPSPYRTPYTPYCNQYGCYGPKRGW